MARKNRIAHNSHDQNRKEAIPLGNPGSSTYRDDPLSDDEGDSRGRGRHKIVSHIQPAKNVTPYVSTSNRAFGGSEVVAQSSLKKNGPLFPPSHSVGPHHQGSSRVVRKSSADAEKYQDRRRPPVPGSSATVRSLHNSGSQNQNSAKNCPPVQNYARPIPPQIPGRNTAIIGLSVADQRAKPDSMDENAKRRNVVGFHEFPGRRRFSSGGSFPKNSMDDMSPLDRILPTMQAAPHSDVGSQANINPSTRVEPENKKHDSSIIKKRRVTFDDESSGRAHLSTSLPVDYAIPTSVANMERPASCSIIDKRRGLLKSVIISDLPRSSAHVIDVVHSKVSDTSASSSTKNIKKCRKDQTTTKQLALLESFTGLKQICYFLPKCSNGFEGSSKLAYKDQFSDVPDPYVYVRSKSTKTKTVAVESNSGRSPNISEPCQNTMEAEEGGVKNEHNQVSASADKLNEASTSALPEKGNSFGVQGRQFVKEEADVNEINENISSSPQLLKTDNDVKKEYVGVVDVKKETSHSDERESSKQSSEGGPSYCHKIKPEPPTVKKEVPEDDDEIVFVAHLTEEAVREISKRRDTNVASGSPAVSPYGQIIPPPLASQWPGTRNLQPSMPLYNPFQQMPLPYGYPGNYPMQNWNGQMPGVSFDPSRPPPHVAPPYYHPNNGQQYNMTGNTQYPSAHFQQPRGSPGYRPSRNPSTRDNVYHSSRGHGH